tara:strand:- start:685 stop:1122 length:438 start_codon:yes stop_codon:yes gene_type:complete
MSIINTHIHRLVFRIDNDAPKEFMDKWNDFKLKCETGDNEHIVRQIKENCQLEQNKNLPYLKRKEGGLGGDDNHTNKQIRFRDYELWSQLPKYIDNDIIFDQIINTEKEIWTYEELDDLIYAFIKTANYNIEAEYVSGVIELQNI